MSRSTLTFHLTLLLFWLRTGEQFFYLFIISNKYFCLKNLQNYTMEDTDVNPSSTNPHVFFDIKFGEARGKSNPEHQHFFKVIKFVVKF